MATPELTLVHSATGQLADDAAGQLAQRVVALEGDLENAERELRYKRALVTKLQKDKQRERDAYDRREVVERIFAYWQQKTAHKRSKLTPERFDACRLRLEEKYSEADLMLAVEGIAFEPFCKARKNGSMERFDDFELCMRTGQNVERFACRAPR